MADPASAAPGIPTLVEFALQSSKGLYSTVSSFQSNQTTVRSLRRELESLNEALETLRRTANTNADVTSLNLPLRRCARACEDFKDSLNRSAEHSSGSRAAFVDWAKIRYIGDDITDIKNVLASCKSTIIILLVDVNVSTSAITSNFLAEYRKIIADTTLDLDEHLRQIDTKLHALSPRTDSDIDATGRRYIQEDRQSAEQCLRICTAASVHIEQAQTASTFENISTLEGTYQRHVETSNHSSSALTRMAGFLKTCKETMVSSTIWLTKHLKDLEERLAALYLRLAEDSRPHAADQKRAVEEIDINEQTSTISVDASDRAKQERINIFEDVSLEDDGRQLIVSTFGDLISAKRVKAGARSVQLMGQMSDDSLQQLSQLLAHEAAGKESEPDTGGGFKQRYGEGWKLST